ncbi:hypothetical protein BC826DRAFT_1009674 [Russula brevipes]|nr:hypothetical protein BC826DRAFT_1009674 [Russula brevipes]
MSAASLSAADFASPVGYLGSSESTPYYPTGDLQDRNIAFTNAMDCVDHLEDYLHGNDDVRIATKFFELAQALSDLGLHEYALNTSGFALDTLERLHTAAPDDSRLHLASILSLRANILYDLKRNDEARDTADRAVSLCKKHRDSQPAPVPELAYALLNHAVLLNSIGLKDESAEVAFELLTDANETQPDMTCIFALCNLCLSNIRIGTDDDVALSMAEEAIELTRTSSDASSQTVLAGALLDKSKILSSRGQNDAAVSLSAEAVTLLRSMSATRPVFSLFLAHALDVHARILSEADRKAESYTIVQNAVELWQTLKVSAPGPIARPLAWALFQLAKFRHRGDDKKLLREELEIAESAVSVFREVVPLDAPGLADALFLYADRMLELDKNREAATYAEESVQYFREAKEKDQKYALDLIFSLSLASSCLACTERGDDAFEYAKQAVEVQHGRKSAEDPQYEPHLRKLLMDVVFRATENDKAVEAFPWFHELQSLDPPGEESVGPVARRSGDSQRQGGEFRKETSYWMDANAGAQSSSNGSASAPAASSSTLSIDKGKGKEVAPSPESGSSTPRIDKGKAKEVNIDSVFDPSTEEIFSPGAAAAAKRGLAGGLGNAGPLMGNNVLGAGAGGNDLLRGFLGLGGGATPRRKTDNRKGDTGARGAASPSTHNGTWSGMGIQSRLSDKDT